MSTPRDFWIGHRVRLRAARDEDWRAFFDAAGDSESDRLASEVRLPPTEAEWRARMTKPSDTAADKAWLVIERLDDPIVVGHINVHDADRRHRSFEYGIRLFPPFWRQGFASEAIALLLRYYFRELGYHRAFATVYAFNAGSLRLHDRLGFTREGVLRENLFAAGEYHDEICFGLLDREFDPLEAKLP